MKVVNSELKEFLVDRICLVFCVTGLLLRAVMPVLVGAAHLLLALLHCLAQYPALVTVSYA